jgi:stress response protein SCP2
MAVELERGSRTDLEELTSSSQVQMWTSAVVEGGSVEFACLGVDRKGRLVGRELVACAAQPSWPNRSLHLEGGGGSAAFVLDLDAIPASAEQLVFFAHVLDATADDVILGRWALAVDGDEVASHSFRGDLHSGERALVLGQVYRRGDAWRVSVVGQGYRTGIAPLLAQYQASSAIDLFASDAAPMEGRPDEVPTGSTDAAGRPMLVNPWRAELTDRLAREAPQLFSLARLAGVSLERHGLSGHAAKVALCLDISLSMDGLYRSGKIQRFAEKILALGTLFDDDGDIDVFLFGLHAHDVGAMNLDNWQGFIDQIRNRYPLEAGTYYGKAMTEIRSHYFGSPGERSEPVTADFPVYVMFLTDGMTADQDLAEDNLRWSSYEPIFWEFMAIGKVADPPPAAARARRRPPRRKKGELPEYRHDFSFLQMLDDLPDRYVDNAAFFSVEDPEEVSTERLYDLMMVEYPGWVSDAPGLGLLDAEGPSGIPTGRAGSGTGAQ